MSRKQIPVTRRSGPRSLVASAQVRHSDRRHPGIIPSLINSTPCTSTTSATLDKVLRHGGLPLGTVTLIADHGTTDFSLAFMKCLCAVSIAESRKRMNSKVICIGPRGSLDWLPFAECVEASAKSPQTANIGSAQTVSNSARETTRDTGSRTDMKIAWRYAKYANEMATMSSTPTHKIDFSKKTAPPPRHEEVVYIELSNPNDQKIKETGCSTSSFSPFRDVLSSVRAILASTPKETLVRVVAPHFLSPLVCTKDMVEPQNLLPFVFELRKTISVYGNAIVLLSLPLILFPRHLPTVSGLELLCDTCIELEPFESNDDSAHGFLHVNRIASLSDHGEMVERRRELTFKVGKHGIVISTFSLPVEESDTSGKQVAESRAASLAELQSDW